MTNKQIGSQIRTLREENNLSLRELETKIGMARITISLIERGKANPTLETIEKILSGINAEMVIQSKP